MNDLLPFIIVGLTSGAVYGMVGVGLVLTFKTSGIFNFGHGSVSALAAMGFYVLAEEKGLPWPLAVLLAGVIFGAVLGLGMERVARSVSSAPVPTKVLATIGIVLAVLSIGALWFPGTPRLVPAYLPTETVELAGVFVGYNQLIVIGAAAFATLLLYAFFRFSRMGVAMRAVVIDPDLLARTGSDPIRVRRWAWVIGSIFAALSGIAVVPDVGLNTYVLTMLVIQAFGAAAVGRFSSLPMTFVGGLLIGVLSALATRYTTDYPSLGGLPPSIPFIVLLVVMVTTPRGKLVEHAPSTLARPSSSTTLPIALRVAAVVAILSVLVLVPQFAGVRLHSYSTAMAMAILIMSLSLLVRVSGQVSLGHMGFAAIGACAMAHISEGTGVPWVVALLLAALVVVPIGALVAIPATRLSGTFLAIATLGFGILLEQFAYPLAFMFTTDQSGLAAPRPSGSIGPWEFGSEAGFYFVLLAFAVAVAVVLQLLRAQPLGRLLRAMGYAVVPLRTQGASTNVTMVLAFCISAFIAGLAGGLMAALSQYAVGTQFTSFQSILLFAVIAVIGVRDPWNALVGAGALVLIPSYADNSTASTYLNLAFGAAAMLYVFVDRVPGRGWRRGRSVEAAANETPEIQPAEAWSKRYTVDDRRASDDPARPAGLEIIDLRVRFGGHEAVRGVSLTAPLDRITGLIGPNGAGKTTIFNAATGLVKVGGGHVVLHGDDVTRLSPQRRARRGLGRTFQQTQLFDSLSVIENVEMGLEPYLVGASITRQIVTRPGHRSRLRRAADEALSLVGAAHLRSLQASDLSAGQRRLVELARCVVAPFDVILLDEPSSGLDAEETLAFGKILRRIVNERHVGLLLVEHDMDLVHAVCDRVFVIDFGSLIFEGTPAELTDDLGVRAAYLGDDPRAPVLELAP